MRNLKTYLVLLAALSAAGCGGDESDDGGGQGAGGGTAAPGEGCGTEAAPQTLEVKDLEPTVGAQVPSGPVVHAFTVADAVTEVGFFNQFAFLPGPGHTAGTLGAGQTQVTAMQAGTDLRYTVAPVTWSKDGHVELSVPLKYKGANGCYSVFPSPLFEYDIGGADAGM